MPPASEPRLGAPSAWSLILALLGLALLAAAFCMQREPVGIWNDDAVYVTQARQFASTGALLNIGGHPRGDTFPLLPGHSLFLVPFVRLFPGSLIALRWVCFGCMAGAAFLFGLALRPMLGDLAAILLGACLLFTPSTMIYGTSILSDTSFTVLLAAIFYGMPRLERDDVAGPALLMGLGMAWLSATRLAGLIVFVAALAVLALRRRQGSMGWLTVGMVLGSLPFVPAYRIYLGHHTGEGLGQMAAWWQVAPARIGAELIGIPPLNVGLGTTSALAWGAGLVILILMACGAWREWRRQGPTFLAVATPLYVLHYTLWPYFSSRYFLAVWPCILVLAWRALPQVRAWVFLSLILVCGTMGVAQTTRESAANADFTLHRFDTYRWMQSHLAPDAVVEDVSGFRTRLLADRPWSTPNRAIEQMSQMLVEACHDRARYLLVEPFPTLEAHVGGGAGLDLLPRLDAWLDASSLVEVVHRSPYDVLYRIKVDPDRFIPAFMHYYAARQGRDPEANLRACLASVSDFPEARTALAAILLPQHPHQAADLLEGVVKQYPVDVGSAVMLARAYEAVGDPEAAHRTLQHALTVGTMLHLPPATMQAVK